VLIVVAINFTQGYSMQFYPLGMMV